MGNFAVLAVCSSGTVGLQLLPLPWYCLRVDADPRPFDLHLHGIADFDTQTDSSDDVLSIAKIEGAEGVANILLSVYPAPIGTMRRHLAAIAKAMERQQSAIDNRLLPGQPHDDQHPAPNALSPARIIGVHLEGPFLNPVQCGALDPLTFQPPSEYAYRQLIEGFEDTIRSITVAPEMTGASELIRQIAKTGVVVNMGHSDALFSEAEAGFRAGARGITHIFNAMRPCAHRDPGIVGFGLVNPEIYVEVIADPHHLHLETLRLVFRVKPAERILIVSDSVKGVLAEAGTKDDGAAGEMGQANGPAVPSTSETGRLKGGSMTVVAAAKRLIAAGFDESTVTRAIAENPACLLGT